jgi:NADPH2:quinone reductase
VWLTLGVYRRLIESGKLKAVVYSEVWPLERVADGLAALEKRKTWGKAIVRVRGDDTPAKL